MTVAYLRVSTVHQHLDNQRGEIFRYAEANGISIDKWITDTVSGKTSQQKRNLGKTLKKLRRGDTLIVTEVSRLSRSLHEIMTIMKYCVERNITIYSTKDGYTFDDSINSKVLSFAFGLAAEIEHKLISQRTKEALALRKSQGVILGRRLGSGDKIRILYENRDALIRELGTDKTLREVCQGFGVSYRTLSRFRDRDDDIRHILRCRVRKVSGSIGG